MSRRATPTQQRQTATLEELLKQSGGGFGGKIPDIDGPNASLYGVYGSNEAAAMQNKAVNDRHFGGSYMASLNAASAREMQQYENQLAAQQEAALQAQVVSNKASFQERLLGALPTKEAPIGTFGGKETPYGFAVQTDPAYASVHNRGTAHKLDTEANVDIATATETAAKAGITTSPKEFAYKTKGYLNSGTDPSTFPQYTTGRTPSDESARILANKALTFDERYKLQELINSGDMSVANLRALQSEGKVKGVIDPDDGSITYTVTGESGTTRSVAEAMSREITGDGVNPRADAQGAGASATQGTNLFVPENITSRPGMRNDPLGQGKRNHNGTDYRGKRGSPYNAEKDGQVVSVGPKQGFGSNVVTVRYDDGEEVFYGHGMAANVKPGQRVAKGQALGLIGSEGRSTGPHVHKQVVRGPQRQAAPAKVKDTLTEEMTVKIARAKGLDMSVTQENGLVKITNQAGNRSQYYDPNTGQRVR